MAIIQKINSFIKKKYNHFSLIDTKALQINKFNPLIIASFIIIFSSLFFVSSNLIEKKNKKNKDNFKEITETSDFSIFTKFLISKISSPYEEINYVIKNNDTVEKILKGFKVRNEDIKRISVQLRQKKLANIYSGRNLNLIITTLPDASNTLINFVYPV